jgi:hypothetical protein
MTPAPPRLALLAGARFSLQRGNSAPRVDNLTSAKHVPRFSLWQMNGRSLNGHPSTKVLK